MLEFGICSEHSIRREVDIVIQLEERVLKLRNELVMDLLIKMRLVESLERLCGFSREDDWVVVLCCKA